MTIAVDMGRKATKKQKNKQTYVTITLYLRWNVCDMRPYYVLLH